MHLQDPVDFDKLVGWTGQMPVKYDIESRDVDRRLMAMFKSAYGLVFGNQMTLEQAEFLLY